MSYLVLARKYRPRTFAELSGQEHVVKTLQGAIRTGRVAHAFLFTGARGVGKTSSARLLAMTLQCQQGPTVEPCGKCSACTEIAAGSSVDVQEIDGASNNGVDQVRELRDAARYLPSRDRFKIYIIDEVHMLTTAAFNALLKTLEEPPPHVKFVFATTEPHKIPLTILSRTQRFDFRRIPLPKIAARVEEICAREEITIDPRAVNLVARQAGGSMRDALSLLDQVVGACGDSVEGPEAEEILGAIDRQVMVGLADALMEGDAAQVLDQIAGVHDRGLDLAHLAEGLAVHLRNLLVMQAGADPRLLLDVGDDEQEPLRARASSVSSAQLTALFELASEAVSKVRRASQPRLALEVALLSAVHLAPTDDLAEILAELQGRPRTPRPRAQARPASAQASPPREVETPPTQTRSAAPVAPPSKPAESIESPRRPAAPASPPPAASVTAAPSRPETPARGKPSIAEMASAMAERAEADAVRDPGEVEKSEAGGPPDRDEPPPLGELIERPEGPGGRESTARPPDTKAVARSLSTRGADAPEAKAREKTPSASASAPTSMLTSTLTPSPGAAAPRLPRGDDPAAEIGSRHAALAVAVATHGARPFLGAALEHARPMEIGEHTLTLAMPRGIYLDGLGSPANRRLLETFLADHFGRTMELRLEVEDTVKVDALPEAIAIVRERELAAHVERVRTEALSNPAVRLAVEALGGEIEDIRILEDT